MPSSAETRPIRVLIVDDHGVVREGLRAYLELEADIQVVGEAKDGLEAVRRAAELQPDVVLMDLVMPNMDGVDATSRIKQQLPATHIKGRRDKLPAQGRRGHGPGAGDPRRARGPSPTAPRGRPTADATGHQSTQA